MHRFHLVILLLMLSLATGCSLLGGRADREAAALDESARNALRDDLRSTANQIEAVLEESGSRLRGQKLTRAQRESAALGKPRIAAAFREEFGRADETTALLGAWGLSMRMAHYLATGEGKTLYGAGQPEALRAAREIESALDGIAARHLDPAKIASTRSTLETTARANPMKGVYEIPAITESAAELIPMEVLSTLTRIPFLPFRAVRGITDTATSVRDFNRTAERFSDIVEDLPRETRWQSELLLLRLESSDVVTSAVASIDETARNTTRYAEVAERLPESVGEAVRQAVREAAEEMARQPELREGLREVTTAAEALRTAVSEARATLAEAKPLLDQVNDIGKTWEGTATEARGLLQIVDEMDRRSGPPKPDSKPFNILEYKQTSDSVRETLSEAGTVLRDAETLASRAEPPPVLGHAAAEARAVIDHLFWRAVQLLVLAGIVAVAVGLLWRRGRKGE